MGALLSSLVCLLASRVIIGIAAGNMSIVQAAVADISSTEEEKAKNFGLYSMALGVGFTLGPFFGGSLASWNYSIPFLFSSIITALNLLFALTSFKETHQPLIKKRLSWTMGFAHLKKAFQFEGLRTILFASFLHNFAWSYFFEFTPVYLISRFHFSSLELGFFFGAAGAYYALSTGFLNRPFIRLLRPETLFFGGMLFTALSISLMPMLTDAVWIWPLMFVICYFVSFVAPNSIMFVSNHVSPHIQGEALGILSSVNAAAHVLSPLFSGSLVGAHPTLPMWVGSTLMFTASLIVLAIFRSRLFFYRPQQPLKEE